MALTNALGDLALDETLAQVRDAVSALTAVLEAASANRHDLDALDDPVRALPYAKTVNDAMRVNVENVSSTVSAVRAVAWGNGDTALVSTYPTWYGTGSPNSIDVREQQRELSVQTFQTTRNRWVFS